MRDSLQFTPEEVRLMLRFQSYRLQTAELAAEIGITESELRLTSKGSIKPGPKVAEYLGLDPSLTWRLL